MPDATNGWVLPVDPTASDEAEDEVFYGPMYRYGGIGCA
jgi:hypothetical protein